MSKVSKVSKWNDAYQSTDFKGASPVSVLKDNHHLLPKTIGRALDLACGRAGNALYLASLGSKQLDIDAVDFSPIVINSLKDYIVEKKLPITAILRDIEADGISEGNAVKYDVIVVSYFLNRSLFSTIIGALKPNGLLFYQTWSKEQIDDKGPKNPDFRLDSGELLTLCTDMKTLFYREEGDSGDIDKGIRNEAMIIAKKLADQ